MVVIIDGKTTMKIDAGLLCDLEEEELLDYLQGLTVIEAEE